MRSRSILVASILLGLVGAPGVLAIMLHDAYVGAQDIMCLLRYEERHGASAGAEGDVEACNLVYVNKVGHRSTRVWLDDHAYPGVLLEHRSMDGVNVGDAWFRRGLVVAGLLVLQAVASIVALVGRR